MIVIVCHTEEEIGRVKEKLVHFRIHTLDGRKESKLNHYPVIIVVLTAERWGCILSKEVTKEEPPNSLSYNEFMDDPEVALTIASLAD